MTQLHFIPVDLGSPIVQCSVADPYVVIMTAEGVVTMFVLKSDSYMGKTHRLALQKPQIPTVSDSEPGYDCRRRDGNPAGGRQHCVSLRTFVFFLIDLRLCRTSPKPIGQVLTFPMWFELSEADPLVSPRSNPA